MAVLSFSDLDDTLYPLSTGLSTACTKNIHDYMVEKLGMDESKIPDISSILYKIYGTTMAGLRAIGYEFDYDDYHSFVHGRLPYENLKPDHVLRNLLLSLPIRKVLFTNGDRIHAAKALSRLGLEDCFEGIICFETLNPTEGSSFIDSESNIAEDLSQTGSGVFDILEHFSRLDNVSNLPKTPILCKPSEAAMEMALKIANVEPHKAIFFDDSIRNIEAGKRIGLQTVLVGTSRRVKGADFALESIHNIKEALPNLWEEAEKSDDIRYSSKATIETSNKMEFDGQFQQSHSTKYECLLFDLDDTLYPLNSGLSEACTKNIEDYMVEKLGIDESKTPDICEVLYKIYGTTMAGLRAIGYEFDYDDYHSFVHGRLPYEKLQPDHVLRNLLLSVPIRRVLFTNGDEIHAAKVLSRLGLEDCFDRIICFETLNATEGSSLYDSKSNVEDLGHTPGTGIFDILEHVSGSEDVSDLPKSPILCKPSQAAMEKALKIANVDPYKTIFFDDSIRNIEVGKRIGLQTVLVGTSHRVKGADFAVENIHNIKEALSNIWEVVEKSNDVRYSSKVTIETSVTA
ncbi:Haloacid dehalogenase-like hydrolase superfamily protein [Cinnamomum micranthum f. kanehirae]|uniref:Haloacid dehalogenase-like hydrolase superfamily protein n=1 Tax=Cinnamomum micranthum f. kanehirae TaxID=337451 RepID=A0A443NEK3_9MAGN|nr:Haloacid dehalogenase-like hydrolase superfamily protein [Cinnamomum micranthum f. kanehirae]